MSYADSIDERATFLDENLISKKGLGSKAFPRLASSILTIFNILIFVTSLSLYVSSRPHSSSPPLLNPELRKLSSYSPVLDAFDLPLEVKKINGTLYPPKHPSIARLPPSPEVDAVWEEWEFARVYPVTADQIRKMGKDPSTVAKLEDSIFGLGPDAYATVFDVYHQLHCLNMLRQLIYPEYYNSTAHKFMQSTDPKAMWEIHMNHCVDILMQTIQCSGNVGLITMHWVRDVPIPVPDMSVNRQCVADFDALTTFRKQHEVNVEKYAAMEKPKAVKELPSADQFYKYFRPDLKNPNHVDGKNEGEDFNM